MTITLRAPVKPATLKPTSEQQAAIDAFRTGEALVLEAGAGTGKTSTLRLMAAAKPHEHGVYIAYNRAIADDARASFPGTVKAATAHSFAFRDVGKDYSHRLNGPRQPARVAADILKVKEAVQVAEKRFLRRSEVARVALDTVARFCNSADQEPTVEHLPEVNGVEDASELEQVVVELARKAWADLQTLDGRLRFQHDHYLKLWALSHPRLPGDYLLLDEAQDANPVIADVVLRQDAQLIAVGDQCQAIYAWRGAVDAMQSWPANVRLPLAQSFRFGQPIADEANTWLARLQAPLRLRGYDAIPSTVAPLEQPKAVLCRTNAETVAQALSAMEAGRKPAIVGGTGEIYRLAKAAEDLKAGRGTEHRDLCAFQTWADVQDYVAEDQAGASDLRVLVRLVDTYGVATMLKVADQAVDEHEADLVVSTAHKAKGREWPTVQIASDFKAPEPGDDDRAESMLAYVAVTRAREQLDAATLRPAQTAAPASHGPTS